MNALIAILRPLVGKNLASLMRSGLTIFGGAAITWGVFTAEQHADGIQLEELFAILLGLGTILASRMISWLRAKALFGRSLSPLAEYLGPLIGRSLHSAVRALFTAVAGGLVTIGVVSPDVSGAELGGMDVSEILAALLLWVIGRIYSYFQERPTSIGIRPSY